MAETSNRATLEDREAVRDVLARYGFAISRSDIELVKSCFHEDSVNQHGPFNGTGWGFADWLRNSKVHTKHHTLGYPYIVAIDATVARVVTSFYGTHLRRNDAGDSDILEQTYGRYLDKLERRSGGPWLISFRRCVLDHTSHTQKAAPWAAEKHFLKGALWPDDPAYCDW